MLTAILDQLIANIQAECVRRVLATPTVGSLKPSTIDRICAVIGQAKTPLPSAIECDDLEWSIYVEKLAWTIASARQQFRGRIAEEMVHPQTSKFDARLFVGLCGLYLHAVAVAQRWSVDYEDDAVQLMAIAAQGLDPRTRLQVVLFLHELAHTVTQRGETVSRSLYDALLQTVAVAKAFAEFLVTTNAHTFYGDEVDYREWRRSLFGTIELAAAELEIAVGKLACALD